MTMAADDLPSLIHWHEGMLLAPQHFQQLSTRHEDLLFYYASRQSPFPWGVQALEIEPALLVEGTLRVKVLEAILPDGLVVTSRDADVGDLEIDLLPLKDGLAGAGGTVHLAVPAKRAGSLATQGDLARYRSDEGEAIADVNTGETERIPRLLPRLRLLVADKPPEKFTSMPLARLRYSNETFELAPFEPPRLQVPGRRCLIGELVSDLAKRLREKAIFLADQVRAPSSATRVPQLIETKMLIHSLVAALPTLETVLATQRAHPFALYLALTSVVGHLAALGRGLVPPILEPYDHNDLYRTFQAAVEYINQVVDEGVQERYSAYPFYLKKGAFYLQFDDEWMGPALVLGVRGQEGATAAEIVAWMEESLIGSRSRIAEMRSLRILGAAREPMAGDADLVPAQGVQLFSLAADPEYIKVDEPLFVINLDDPDGFRRPVEILLYVRNRS
jgi:type VI secretion system protein ImpJ